VAPAFWALVLFRWDINVRESIVLGLVGAGGIGMALDTALNLFQWTRVAMVLVAILAVVVVAEGAVTYIRKKIIWRQEWTPCARTNALPPLKPRHGQNANATPRSGRPTDCPLRSATARPVAASKCPRTHLPWRPADPPDRYLAGSSDRCTLRWRRPQQHAAPARVT